MVNLNDTMNKAKQFNEIKLNDRIVYRHNGIKTRRVQKISKTSVIVNEGDKQVRVAWDKIIRA